MNTVPFSLHSVGHKSTPDTRGRTVVSAYLWRSHSVKRLWIGEVPSCGHAYSGGQQGAIVCTIGGKELRVR